MRRVSSIVRRGSAALAIAAAAAGLAAAQIDELSLAPEEAEAFEAARRGRYVRARELATGVLRTRPDSVAAGTALAIALHEGEGNIPLALRHYQRVRRLAEGPGGLPRAAHEALHREILYLELRALSDLGRYEELLETSATLRRLYDPHLHSVDVWPLMKLGRVAEARAAIERALESGDRFEEVVARNGLCALDGYEECMTMLEAVERHRLNPGLALRNAGVSAALAGRLEEAERLLVESTRRPDEDTNPWRDLVDLYLMEGRLGEAAGAARKMLEFGRLLPPRERQYSRADELVAGAKVLLVAGEAERALRATELAIRAPDRAAHWSGSAPELQAEGALLHRAVRRTLTELERERAAAGPWYAGLVPRVSAVRHGLGGWFAGRRVLPLLFRGGLRIKSDPSDRDTPSLSGPLWLVLDAIEVFGAGPASSLVEDVRSRPGPPGAAVPETLRAAQLDAMAAEARFLLGDWDGTLRAGASALEGLPAALTLVRTRIEARMAHAAWRSGDAARAFELYLGVIDRDPAALRRLGQPLPVSRGRLGSGDASRAARRALSSPRFAVDPASPLVVGVSGGRPCLAGPDGSIAACGSPGEEAGDAVTAMARSLLDEAFSPRVDLSQQDLSSLDGTTVVRRGLDLGPLDRMLMEGGDE